MSMIKPSLRICALLAGVLLVLPQESLEANTLYVSPQGNDAWSGKLQQPNPAGTDGPLATLLGARNAVRKLKAQSPLQASVQVKVSSGIYSLSETLVFEPEDSGSSQGAIVYEAADKETSRVHWRKNDPRFYAV